MRRGYRRPPFLTIGICCCWLHFVNRKVSIIVLVSAFFVCGWLLHVSADICMFLMFAVKSLREATLRICKSYCNNVSEMRQQSCKFPLKLIWNRPKWCPGALKKASWKYVHSRILPGGARTGAYNASWTPLGRFLAPFGTQLGAKGVPKSSIWASRRAQSRKNSIQEEV